MKYNHRFYMPMANFVKEPFKSRNPNFMKYYIEQNQSLPTLRNKGKNSSLSIIDTAILNTSDRAESVDIHENKNSLAKKHKSV